MDKDLRTSLRTVVAACRQVLEEDVRRQLEGTYGVTPRGEFLVREDVEPYAVDVREWRREREEILAAVAHIESYGVDRGRAVEQFVRESAFTVLNRLAALKLMEHASRVLIPESVGQGKESKGFLLFQKVSPEGCRAARNGAVLDGGYRLFLECIFDDLTEELGVIFDRRLPQSIIFISDGCLKRVLELLNQGNVSAAWSEDETIGWIYQYFTPKDLRDRARRESQSPRNSYELAFRNQFYTPRYVVQILVDNTLGQIWYESRGGTTKLRETCPFLAWNPEDVFLGPGEMPPKEATSPRRRHIRSRARLDPRALRILDPACGSGHFLLYAFEVLEAIYLEAWDDLEAPAFGDTARTLRDDYPSKAELLRAVPALVIAHNLHGIDIDLRATQIASLALWLRAQRCYQSQGLKVSDRPRVLRSNIVCAEPMPGEQELLSEFVSKLTPTLLGQLVRVVFEKMALAGEAGCLLKVDQEIREAVREAKQQWEAGPKKEQLLLFPEVKRSENQLRLFDTSGITETSFWDEAEARVLEALRVYSEGAVNGRGYRRRLFAEDAAQGFAFVDLCRKRFDVILMNPPFGDFTKGFKDRARELHPNSYNDIFAAFTEHCFGMLNPGGALGAITSRAGFFLSSFGRWRAEFLLKRRNLRLLVDLGEDVMDDAMVEAAAYCLRSDDASAGGFPVVRVLGLADRHERIRQAIAELRQGQLNDVTFWCHDEAFEALPDRPFVYWVDSDTLRRLAAMQSFEPTAALVRQGLVTGDNPRFVRALWEVSPASLGVAGGFSVPGPTWAPLVMAGASQPWYSPITVVVKWADNGREMKDRWREKGDHPSRNIRSEENLYFKPGLSWTRRAVRFVPYAIPAGCIPTASRYMAFPKEGLEFAALGATASNLASAFLRFYGEKFAWPNFLVETVKALPWPGLSETLTSRLENVARTEAARRRRAYQNHEPFQDFTAPSLCFANQDSQALAVDWTTFLGKELERDVAATYGLSEQAARLVERDLREALSTRRNGGDAGEAEEEEEEDGLEFSVDETPQSQMEALISYAVGVAFGRWDVRIGRQPALAPRLPGPFEPLPQYPPGGLVGPDGLPASSGRIVSEEWLRARPDGAGLPSSGAVPVPVIADSEYPARVDWDGILVDDEGHPDDIVGRVREVMSVLFADRADAIEKEACERLGVSDLRAYFRAPKHFFEDHIKRYTKSRRKAPIYWLLQSSKRGYGLWLYYQRLDRDSVFKVLRNYVEPKINGEMARLRELKGRLDREGESLARRVRAKLEKDVEKQEAFVSELDALRQALERVAGIGYAPDFDDGVLLNVAPFRELMPWKEAANCWSDLLDGKHEWSAIAHRLRERGVINTATSQKATHG